MTDIFKCGLNTGILTPNIRDGFFDDMWNKSGFHTIYSLDEFTKINILFNDLFNNLKQHVEKIINEIK